MATLSRADALLVALMLGERESQLAAQLDTPARTADTALALSETRRLCRIFDRVSGRCLDFTRTD